jgi:cytoskeleton protein RodZ
MADIGATLREARMRQKIDISEVEAETKIRAKYLRALENEEWGLLPGSTFVKTFLRTYAEYLGLDARLLLEEYKLRFEPTSTSELPPLRPLSRRREPTRMRPPGPPRGLLVGVAIVGLLFALFVLGSLGNDDGGSDSGSTPTTATTKKKSPSKSNASSQKEKKTTTVAKVVRLQVIPTGPVWVCLENASGDRLIPGATQNVGGTPQTYRSKRFVVTFGNGNAQMRIDGKVRDVPDRDKPVGYRVTSEGRVELPADQAPTCA